MTAAAPPAPGRGWLGWRVWVRTLHLYASLAGLGLLLFFAATGFALNHGDWFGLGKKQVDERAGQVRAALEPLDEQALLAELRATHGVQGGLVELRAEGAEVSLRFARPGEDTDVVVERATGALRITREQGRTLDLLTDLHKGERGGTLGGLLVDATAVLLLVISLTGLALWLSMPRRRRSGLAAIVLSLALAAGAVVFILR